MPKSDSGKAGGNPGKAPQAGALDESVQRASKAAAKPGVAPKRAGRETQPNHPPQKRRALRDKG